MYNINKIMHHHHPHTQISFIFNPFGWYYGTKSYSVNTPFSTFVVSVVFISLFIYLIIAAIKKYRTHKHKKQTPSPSSFQ